MEELLPCWGAGHQPFVRTICNAINQGCLTSGDQFLRLADGFLVSTSDQLGNISLQPAVRGDNFSTSNLYSNSPPCLARCNPSTFTNFFQSFIVWKDRKIKCVIDEQFFISTIHSLSNSINSLTRLTSAIKTRFSSHHRIKKELSSLLQRHGNSNRDKAARIGDQEAYKHLNLTAFPFWFS